VKIDPRQEVGEAFCRRHLQMMINDCLIRVVETRQVEMEIQPTTTDHLSQGFEARVNIAPLPSSDNGLRFANRGPKLSLCETRPQSGLSD
jgi:hypothetical protein